jgi:hypothetical protein
MSLWTTRTTNQSNVSRKESDKLFMDRCYGRMFLTLAYPGSTEANVKVTCPI